MSGTNLKKQLAEFNSRISFAIIGSTWADIDKAHNDEAVFWNRFSVQQLLLGNGAGFIATGTAFIQTASLTSPPRHLPIVMGIFAFGVVTAFIFVALSVLATRSWYMRGVLEEIKNGGNVQYAGPFGVALRDVASDSALLDAAIKDASGNFLGVFNFSGFFALTSLVAFIAGVSLAILVALDFNQHRHAPSTTTIASSGELNVQVVYPPPNEHSLVNPAIPSKIYISSRHGDPISVAWTQQDAKLDLISPNSDLIKCALRLQSFYLSDDGVLFRNPNFNRFLSLDGKRVGGYFVKVELGDLQVESQLGTGKSKRFAGLIMSSIDGNHVREPSILTPSVMTPAGLADQKSTSGIFVIGSNIDPGCQKFVKLLGARTVNLK